MRLNLKLVHLTNENIFNGSLDLHRGVPPPPPPPLEGGGEGEEQHNARIPTDWDFSHVDYIIEALLKQKPDHDVYLYGSVESAYDSSRPGADVADQAPVFVAITLPSGRVPTRTVGRVNNQTSEVNLMSFDDLSYSWVAAEDPSFGGRVHYLICNADTTAIPDDEDEAQKHQHCSLFVPTPRDIERDSQGRYIVDHVTFSFLGEDGEEETESWDRSENITLRERLDEIVEDYFEDSSVEERAIGRERIEQAARREMQSIRQRRQQQLNLFFGEDLNWNQESLNDLGVFKITPVNFPASISNKVDRYFNEYSKQQAGGPVCYSDHASISGGAFVHKVPSDVLTRFVNGFDRISPTSLLFQLLMVDFLKSTFFIDNLRELNNNIKTSETPVIFDRVIRTFGIDRVLQYFGQNTTAPSYSFMKQRLQEVVRELCRNLEDACKRARRIPSTPSDFLLNFIWQNQNASSSRSIPNVVSIRLGQFNNNARLSRTRNPGSLEARFRVGNRAGFVPINIDQLEKYVSRRSIPELLLQLLCNPQAEANVPPGARDDDHDHERRDCLKAAIRAAPDELLSPTGKKRVDATFPDHEVTLAKARSLLNNKVKTIRLKEIKRNVHTHAMKSAEVMVGVFYDGPLKHCVLIDGRNGTGSITDPATRYKKGLVRSERSLRKLKIDKFRKLFVLVRVELSHKNRKRSAMSLGLPFLPSV